MDKELQNYIIAIKEYINKDYSLHFHDPVPPKFKYPFFTSGINYVNQIWDWGCWQASIAFRSFNDKRLEECQKGNILNFLENMDENGKMPIVIDCKNDTSWWIPENGNCFKPCLALHTLEICEKYNDFDWIKDKIEQFKRFISCYDKNQFDKESGLYYWIDDFAIGVDNDPAVFYRPNKSTGHIFLNCLMYSELISLSKLLNKLNMFSDSDKYLKKAEDLKKSIQNECYDPIDGFYYSVDLSLKKVNKEEWLHSGCPRHWHSLPIKIKSWVSMLPLWAGIATKEQADNCVKHYLNPFGLFSDYGIRSLAKNEKMYMEVDSGNPSCALGPIWINANYFVFLGLKNYGYIDLAKNLAIKTVKLLGKDLSENGGFHEYYNSITGKGIRGLGMHGWNFLVLEMIEFLISQEQC